HYDAGRFYVDEEPVFFGRAFLHRAPEILHAVLLDVNHRVDFRILACNGGQQNALRTVDQYARGTLRADVDATSIVGGDAAVGPAKGGACGQLPPIGDHAIRPFAVAGDQRSCGLTAIL